MKKTVLIVDDQMSFRKIYHDNLVAHGYDTIEAENGIVGLDALEKAPRVDLVLLDIAMPLKSGIEVLTAIRANPRWKNLPVIVLSVFDERVRFYDEVMKLGVSDYAVKGRGTLDDLMKKIDSVLGSGSGWGAQKPDDDKIVI